MKSQVMAALGRCLPSMWLGLSLLTACAAPTNFEPAAGAKKYRQLPLGTPVVVADRCSELTPPIEVLGVLRATTAGEVADRAEAETLLKRSAPRYGCDSLCAVKSKRREVETRRKVRVLAKDGTPKTVEEVQKSYEFDWVAQCVRSGEAPREEVAMAAASATQEESDEESAAERAEAARREKEKAKKAKAAKAAAKVASTDEGDTAEAASPPAKTSRSPAKAEAKAETKTEAKPEPKAEPKPEPKSDAKADAKAPSKSETKAEAKAESKAAKAGSKPAVVEEEEEPEVTAPVAKGNRGAAKTEATAEAKGGDGKGTNDAKGSEAKAKTSKAELEALKAEVEAESGKNSKAEVKPKAAAKAAKGQDATAAKAEPKAEAKAGPSTEGEEEPKAEAKVPAKGTAKADAKPAKPEPVKSEPIKDAASKPAESVAKAENKPAAPTKSEAAAEEARPAPPAKAEPPPPVLPVVEANPKLAIEVAKFFRLWSKQWLSGMVDALCASFDEEVSIDISTGQPLLKIKKVMKNADACESLRSGELMNYLKDFGPSEVHAEVEYLLPSLFVMNSGPFLKLDEATQRRYAEELNRTRAAEGKKILQCTSYAVTSMGEDSFAIQLGCQGVQTFKVIVTRMGEGQFKVLRFTHLRN